MGHLQMKMIRAVEVNSYGAWPIPVEAVGEVRSSMLALLQTAEGSGRRIADREDMDSAKVSKWDAAFQHQGRGVVLAWQLTFCRALR